MYLITTDWSGPSIKNMHRVQTLDEVVLYLKLLHKKEFPKMSLKKFVSVDSKFERFKVYRTELNCPLQPLTREEINDIKCLLLEEK